MLVQGCQNDQSNPGKKVKHVNLFFSLCHDESICWFTYGSKNRIETIHSAVYRHSKEEAALQKY